MDSVLFFDDECAFCNRYVQFILKFERSSVIKFAALSGNRAKLSLPDHLRVANDTIVFLKGGKIYTKGEALREICKVSGLTLFGLVLRFFPLTIINLVYANFGAVRYALFGRVKNRVCEIVSADVRKRFLD